jgi:hypothetical protein
MPAAWRPRSLALWPLRRYPAESRRAKRSPLAEPPRLLLRQRGPLRPLSIQAQLAKATTALQQQRLLEPALRQSLPEIHPSSGSDSGSSQRRRSPAAPPEPPGSPARQPPHPHALSRPPATPRRRQPPPRCPKEPPEERPSCPPTAASPRAQTEQWPRSEQAARRRQAPETFPPMRTTKRYAQDRRLLNRSQLSRRGWCAGRARGRRRGPRRSAARGRAGRRAGSRPCARCSPPSACRRGR